LAAEPGVIGDMDVGEVAAVVIEEYDQMKEFSYLSWLLMLVIVHVWVKMLSDKM